VEQWHRLARTLLELGVEIGVLPAAGAPGLLFPSSAGFLAGADSATPFSQKRYHLSRLPNRTAENAVISAFLRAMGFSVQAFPQRFGGGSDFLSSEGCFLFSSGVIRRPRFVFSKGWPPFRRCYGFQSAPSALDALAESARGKKVLPVTLIRETHFSGNTCLCPFGKNREFLMAYLPALSESSRARLKEQFGERLLGLSEPDGEGFAANAFQVDVDEPVLLLPHTVSEALQAQVRERGVRPVLVDVSEFFQKAGGAVASLIGDLGPLPTDDAELSPGAVEFRRENSYPALFA